MDDRLFEDLGLVDERAVVAKHALIHFVCEFCWGSHPGDGGKRDSDGMISTSDSD